MKLRVLQLLVFLPSSLLLGFDVRMRVVDEDGIPVAHAKATIAFIGIVQGSGRTHDGITGVDGQFSATGRAQHSVFLVAKKAGYYEARVDGLSSASDLDQIVVLPRILNPTPLCVWDSRIGKGILGLRFPAQSEWLGFDFEVCDWVEPHGTGRVPDLRMKFTNEFLDWKHSETDMANNRRINPDVSETEMKRIYGKWDAELEISFPDEGGGIVEATRFLAYSRLKLPHQAPASGYGPARRYTANSYSPRRAGDDVGFFLRTRVKRDAGGRITSANYAKIMGDFQVDPRGGVRFAYYFNPIPNNRNLEFDPERNLLPSDLPGTRVFDP